MTKVDELIDVLRDGCPAGMITGRLIEARHIRQAAAALTDLQAQVAAGERCDWPDPRDYIGDSEWKALYRNKSGVRAFIDAYRQALAQYAGKDRDDGTA